MRQRRGRLRLGPIVCTAQDQRAGQVDLLLARRIRQLERLQSVDALGGHA